MNVSTRRLLGGAASAVALLGVAACGVGTDSETASARRSASPKPVASASTDPAADLVGPGCGDYLKAVADSVGSVDGMAREKLVNAASTNPLLRTLTAAVSGRLNRWVTLVDVLNGGEFTVFAPVDAAFAKLPRATRDLLRTHGGARMLTSVLAYHVVDGRLPPSSVAGVHKTLQGSRLDVTGSSGQLKVNGVPVICGGVHTANATVYLIGTLLNPADRGHL